MPQDELSQMLEKEAEECFSGGRLNNLSDLTCSIGAIVTSFIAAIFAAGLQVHPAVTASIASLPGVFTALQRVVNFRGRSAWYFKKASKLKSLGRRVRFANLPTEKATQEIEDIESTMAEQWTDLIGGGTASKPEPTKPK